MNPGTNEIRDGAPGWLRPDMALSDQKMVALVVMTLAIIGFIGVVIYGVRQRIREAERRRNRQV